MPRAALTMPQALHGESLPVSAWVARFSHLVPRTGESEGTVLDVASGAGRNARHFLTNGYRVAAIDRDTSALADLARNPSCEIVTSDLESGAPFPLSGRRFAAVVVTNYLHRPLIPELVAAVEPGGVLIYETFAAGNERFGHPRNPDFLLRPGELLEAVRGKLRVIAFEEGFIAAPRPAVIERICAQCLLPGAPPAPLASSATNAAP